MRKNNIILIGMPASGKSTMGVILAKILGYNFIDSDILIQETDGRNLPQIIEDEGIEGFIEIENRINAGIETEKTVIATGGSVVYGKEAMDHFKNIGRIIYLKVDMDVLTKRLHHTKQRGVVMQDGQSLIALYNERGPLYEKYADIVVEEGRDGFEEVIAKILSKMSTI